MKKNTELKNAKNKAMASIKTLAKFARSANKTSQTIAIVLGVTFLQSFLYDVACARQQLQPILSLHFGSARNIPLVEQGLRDPALTKSKISHFGDADDSEANLRELHNQLTNSKATPASKKSKTYLKIMEAHARLAYFYADIKSGEISDATYSNGIKNKLRKHRVAVGKYASLYKKTFKRAGFSTNRAAYHAFISQYMVGSRTSAVRSLRKLATEKNLNNYLKRRAKFAVAKWDIDRGNAKKIIVMSSLIPTLPRSAAIAARLTIARFYAGLDRNGRQVRKTNSKYRRYLIASGKRSSKLSKNQRNSILALSLAIWRSSEGKTSTWSNPPLYLAAFPGAPEKNSIYERLTIELLSGNNLKSGIRRYKVLSTRLSDQGNVASIDRRILSLENKKYLKDNSYVSYEKTIQDTILKYKGSMSSHTNADFIVRDSEAQFASLTNREVARASSKSRKGKYSKKNRKKTIHLAYRYLESIKEHHATGVADERMRIRESIGSLLVMNREHEKAVAVYLLLANLGSPHNKSKYLSMAINSQRVLASWPKSTPWTKQKLKKRQQRFKLIELYRNLAQTKDKTDWSIISQIGQLLIAQNKKSEAYSEWNTALKLSPYGKIPAIISGIMLLDTKSAKKWQDLEDLSRFCRTKNLKPTNLQNRPLNLTTLLALALLEGGKQSFSKKQFRIATKKLAEFVYKFKEKNRDQGMFFLASSYHGEGNHPASVKTVMEFSEQYTKSVYYRQAMLNGGNWSIPMTLEENAMYFYKRYLSKHPRDKSAARVRNDLASLYVGRSLYAEAIDVMRSKLRIGKISRLDRQKTTLRILHLEETYGSAKRASKTADALLRTESDDGMRAEALVIKARAYAAKSQIAKLKNVERSLRKLDERPTVLESLAETRFLLAAFEQDAVLVNVNSLSLRKPRQELVRRMNKYNKLKRDYSKVCSVGSTSYCVPALHSTARTAERLISIVEDVTIPVTLPNASIVAFDTKKDEIIKQLSSDIMASDEQAYSMIKNGQTNPEWTQQVYWQSYSDVNFERVSGESGRAFVQWPIGRDD